MPVDQVLKQKAPKHDQQGQEIASISKRIPESSLQSDVRKTRMSDFCHSNIGAVQN